MTKPSHEARRAVTLTRHPASGPDAVSAIDVSIERRDRRLEVAFRIAGGIAHLKVPAPKPPGPANLLWQHTCCEVFVRCPGAEAYHELNLAPSGEWAAYAFSGYRERTPLADDSGDPHITTRVTPQELALAASLKLDCLSPDYADCPIAVALSCVIETADAQLTYWALAHPAAKPDFHHPQSFVLSFDEVRR